MTLSIEQMEEVKTNILTILDKVLPKQAYREVWLFRGITGINMGIKFAVSDKTINDVRGQYPQMASLALWNYDGDLILKPQSFGGCGGQSIYRKPNKMVDSEKYLVMKNIKIPFRKPKHELKFIYSAVERFANNWLKALKENKDVLMYQDLIDYDAFLGQ